MVFSKGSTELFVVRVASNVLGRECLGSLRYAVGHFPATLKLFVVLVHARCGTVTEAVDVYLVPRRYLELATDQSVRSIEDQILVAVRVAAMGIEMLYGDGIVRQPECRAALLEAVVVLNAAWSAYCLRQEFRAEFPDLGVVYGAYDLITRRLRLPLSPPGELTAEEYGLFVPPEDAEGFRQLSLHICGSKLVQSVLGREPRELVTNLRTIFYGFRRVIRWRVAIWHCNETGPVAGGLSASRSRIHPSDRLGDLEDRFFATVFLGRGCCT
jgi:carbonic anhydrase